MADLTYKLKLQLSNGTETEAGTFTVPQGQSAYEVAVANGYTGSESAWLASLKGDTGSQGIQGIQGPKGDTGAKGDSGSVPPFAQTTADCTDPTKLYLLPDGYLYAYFESTTIQTITDNVATDDNPIMNDARLGSDGSSVTAGYAGYVITPWIDVTKYPYPFTLHLEGANFVPSTQTGNTNVMAYDASKTKLSGGASILNQLDSWVTIPDGNVTKDSSGNISILVNEPIRVNGTSTPITYIRWSGTGEPDTTHVYVTYEGEVTGSQWTNTGLKYSPTLTNEEKAEIAELAASLIDTQLLSVIGEGDVVV